MNVCSPRNPNICVDCEALTIDDSPASLVQQTEAGSGPEESAGSIEQTEGGEAFPMPQLHASQWYSCTVFTA